MTSTGQGEPAMIPVRREVRSYFSKSGCSSSAMNIVGTPYSDVQRSSCTVASTASGSNPASGMTIVAPWVTQPRMPMTMPKQW